MGQGCGHRTGHSNQECVVEMSYLRGACGVSKWDGESNESIYEWFVMSMCANGVKYGEVKWVKTNTLKWSGYIERMKNEEFGEKVDLSDIEGAYRRGRPLGWWRDRVREYICKRGSGKGGACLGRGGGYCCDHTLGRSSWRGQGIRDYK